MPKQKIEKERPKAESSTKQPTKTQILDLLVCGICLDLFKDPHGLDCGHSYCGECLLTWFQQSKICPSCNSPSVRQPVPNHTLNNIVGLYHEPSNARLTRDDWQKVFKRANQTEYLFDSDDAVARCTTCHWELNEEYMCERCELQYQRGADRPNQTHHPVQVSESDDDLSLEHDSDDLSDFVVSDSHSIEFDTHHRYDRASESELENTLNSQESPSRILLDDEASESDEGQAGYHRFEQSIDSDNQSHEGNDSSFTGNKESDRGKTYRRRIIIPDSTDDEQDSENDGCSNNHSQDGFSSDDSRHDEHVSLSNESEDDKSIQYDRDSLDESESLNHDSPYEHIQFDHSSPDKDERMLYDNDSPEEESETIYPDYVEKARTIESSDSDSDENDEPDYDFTREPTPQPESSSKSKKSKKRKAKSQKKKDKKAKKAKRSSK